MPLIAGTNCLEAWEKNFTEIIIVKGSWRISKSKRARRMSILCRRKKICKLLEATTIHVIFSGGWEVLCGWRYAGVRTGERSRSCLDQPVKAWARKYTQARSLLTSILVRAYLRTSIVEINRTYPVMYLPKKERDGLMDRWMDRTDER